jgi:hypothetical protein
VNLEMTDPVNWILPALLVLTWLALWVTRRRVGVWFFLSGLLLAVLCVPAGMIAAKVELNGTDCTPGNLCFSAAEVGWWCNGLFAFLTTGVLAVLTPTVSMVLTATRGERSRTGTER